MVLKINHNQSSSLYSLTAFLLSLFISGFIIRSWLISFNFALDVPAKLFISQATFEGQDVEKRLSCFFTLLFRSALLLPVLFLSIKWCLKKINIRSDNLYFLNVFSGTGVILFLCSGIGVKCDGALALMSVALLFVFLLLSSKQFIPWYRHFNKPSFITSVFCLAFILVAFLLFLYSNYSLSYDKTAFLFGAMLIIVSLIMIVCKKLFNVPIKVILYRLQFICIFPLCIFLSIETAFLLKSKYEAIVSPYFLCFIYIAIGGMLYFISARKKTKPDLAKNIKFILAPSTLLSFILLTLYHPVIPFSHEIFELANPANALMRIFAFGEVPCVDFMSSHMMAEQFFGIIYFLIFGFDYSQSFLVYGFIYTAIFIAMAFIFLKQLFNNAALAVLFIVFFPFIFPFFSVHLFFGVLVFWAVRKILLNQSATNFIWLFALLVLLIVWRLDAGSATLFSTCFFLPLAFYTTGKRLNWKNAIKGIVISLLVLFVITLCFILLRSPEYLLNNIKSAFHYISANQAHGYSYLSQQLNHQFYIYHLLIPVFSMIAIFYSAYILRKHKISWNSNEGFTLSASIFFFMICLFSFQRGLVRHTFMEGSEHFLVSTFYLALALFILFHIKSHQPYLRYLYFFSISVMVFMVLKYFPISTDPTLLQDFSNNNSLTKSYQYISNPTLKERILPDHEFAAENYNDLKTFLDVNLTDKQSFFDFSNSPMLYYYCHRNVPSYFCQSQQNSVDDFLQLDLIKRNTTETTPVVLFSNYPANWFDATDNVPNTLRQYLMAEYIFSNYKPYCVLSKRSVWVANNKTFKGAVSKIDTVINIPKTYNYNMGPHYINRYYEINAFEHLRKINSITVTDSGDIAYVNIDSAIASLHHVYARIVVDNPADAETLTVSINDSEGHIAGAFLIRTVNNSHAYMIRLSTHYLWHVNQAKQLTISKNKNALITHVEFYKDTRL